MSGRARGGHPIEDDMAFQRRSWLVERVSWIVLALIGFLLVIFTYLGVKGHQLVRVYEVRFAEPELYARDQFACVEANGIAFTCVWRPIREFGQGVPLYPDGLLQLLK